MKIHTVGKTSYAVLLGLVFCVLAGNTFGQSAYRKVNDFDGDGKADYAVTRNINGQKYWYVWKSASGSSVVQFGLDTDVTTAGDYDGDGKTDYSIYRRLSSSSHHFWVLESRTNAISGAIYNNIVGTSVTPFAQDYTGDGRTDPAIAVDNGQTGQPFLYVLDNSIFRRKNFTVGTVPVKVGDLTGDRKSDVVFYDSANQITTKNYSTETSQSMQFGTTGDEYLPADFDGDNIGDLTVFRQSNGTWWWLRSSDNVLQAAEWGANGDTAVPADYDGDGKTDLAIWRNGVYWIMGSQTGVKVFQWGISSDKPVTY